ncbi:4-phosphopantetheine adenylyltransferase isoform 1 [Hibiscus syriacus]|uniref:4-phosphopantetheine adenylyltransferase isoform 1 n=1 Tax=Hibiscus syriacus TaxID=106335 RepID=A0A6A3BCY8_HIBSY|nr:4-phosphopantetheine adenylyltransferase isoform 1 [Hibiscus syriacus]
MHICFLMKDTYVLLGNDSQVLFYSRPKAKIPLFSNLPLRDIFFIPCCEKIIVSHLPFRLERRISELRNELAEWVLEKEEDGRESCFIFNAFSNTGWLIYGSLLDSFLGRDGLREKIKGGVIDSGADPFNPKVWAAGLTAVILKKQSYLVSGLGSAVTDSKLQKEEPRMIEAVVLSTLEKFFASILNMPDVNRFVFNIYKDEGRPENKQTIYQIPLLVPKVSQQRNGKECVNFVLYFIKSFVECAPENFSIEGYPLYIPRLMKKDWFSAEEVERFCERLDSPACDFH